MIGGGKEAPNNDSSMTVEASTTLQNHLARNDRHDVIMGVDPFFDGKAQEMQERSGSGLLGNLNFSSRNNSLGMEKERGTGMGMGKDSMEMEMKMEDEIESDDTMRGDGDENIVYATSGSNLRRDGGVGGKRVGFVE